MLRSRLITTCCLGLGLALGSVPASEASADTTAETTPLVTVTAPDIQASIERWHGNIWYRLWQDPSLAEYRAMFDAQIEEGRQEALEEVGVDPFALFGQAQSFTGTVTAFNIAAQQVAFRVQATFAEGAEVQAMADALFAKGIEEGDLEATTIEGATTAAQTLLAENEQGIVVQFAVFGSSVVIATPDHMGPPQAVLASEHDFELRIPEGAFARLFESNPIVMMLMPNAQQLLEIYRECGAVSYNVDILPSGFKEHMHITAMPAVVDFFRPVDLAVAGRLPGSTLMSLAGGVDGAKLWTMLLETGTLASLGQNMGLGADAESFEAFVDQQFMQMGIEATLQGLITGFDGTSLFAITPSMPFPAGTFAIPRSPDMDQAIAFGLLTMGMEAPAEGTAMPLQIPNAQLPILPQIARTTDHWVVSTDAGVINSFLNNSAGGWRENAAVQTALSEAGADPVKIGVSDTQKVLGVLMGYVPMMAMAGGMPQEVMGIINTLSVKLRENAESGYLYARMDEDGSGTAEIRSLTGVLSLPIAAGVLMPIVQQAQRKAWRAEREAARAEREREESAVEPESADDF